MNKCIYDFDNQQYDIKLYKKWDFEGCYIIYNIDKDIYHIYSKFIKLRKNR